MEQPASAKICVKNVDVVYNPGGAASDRVVALRDVSITIYENQIVSFVGPSGCGKTTLLMLLAGLLEPNHGEVLLDGKPVRGPGRERAVVFQEDAIFPWLTVRRNIEYGPRLKGLPHEEVRKLSRHYIRLVQLDGFEDRFPRELSGGMKKRVDIARCYANNPSVLLMDEPFGSLDVMTKEKMQVDLLSLWHSEPKTICFVTHDIEEALFISNRVAIFSSRPGRIIEEVTVPFGEEREPDLKVSREFQELRSYIWHLLARQLPNGRDEH